MIAIPNKDKPKGCVDCPVNDMVCELWTEVANIKAHKHKDCPLIDIVPCGECKWWESANNGWNGWCRKQIDAYATFHAEDFCSYGERKEK